MTTTTQTFGVAPRTRGPSALRRFFDSVAALLAAPADRDVRLSASELHAMADRYEASQPSFAADLRAAAERQS